MKADVVSGALGGDEQVMSTNQYAAADDPGHRGDRPASGGTALVDGQPVFENPGATRRVCLIRETGDTGDKDDRVSYALYTAAHLRPGWDGDYADALIDRFQIPRRAKLGELSLGQRSALGTTFGLASRAPVTLFDESHLGMDALSPLFEEVVIIDNGRLVLQDETEVLRARGADITGPAEAVDRFVAGRTALRDRVQRAALRRRRGRRGRPGAGRVPRPLPGRRAARGGGHRP